MPTARGSWRRDWRRIGKAEVDVEVDADMVEEKLEEEEEEEAEEEEKEEEENNSDKNLTTLTWQVGKNVENQPLKISHFPSFSQLGTSTLIKQNPAMVKDTVPPCDTAKKNSSIASRNLHDSITIIIRI